MRKWRKGVKARKQVKVPRRIWADGVLPLDAFPLFRQADFVEIWYDEEDGGILVLRPTDDPRGAYRITEHWGMRYVRLPRGLLEHLWGRRGDIPVKCSVERREFPDGEHECLVVRRREDVAP